MQHLVIETTLGAASVRIPYAVAIETGGMDHNGNLWVTVWTSSNRTTGYHIRQNVKTGERYLKRLTVSYVDQDSRMKYGRQAARKTLPIVPA